jgi:hypothetical protein
MTSHEAAVAKIDGAIARVLLEDRRSAQIYSTHNNTMVCTANLILDRAGLPLPQKPFVFDNVTVLAMCGEEDGSCSITMIYPAVVSNPGRYTSPEVFNDAMRQSSHMHLNFPRSAHAYFFRHGVCLHNDSMTPKERARDCLLTEIGVIQVRGASLTIATCLEQLDKVALTMFCSDLQRSWHSLQILLDCLPQKFRQSLIEMCIESRERTRVMNTPQQWEDANPLRALAIDPYRPDVKDYTQLFPPGTTLDVMERSLVENMPLSPIKGPVTVFEGLEIDSRDYDAKVHEAEAIGETFGHAASRIQFLDVIIQNAQRAQQALQ